MVAHVGGRAALNLGSDRLSPQQRELAAIAESRGNFGGVRRQDIPPFSGRFLDLVLEGIHGTQFK